MPRRNGLIVVTEQAQVARVVADTVVGDNGARACHVCGSLEELANFMDRSDPSSTILVDIDGDPERVLDDLADVTRRFGDARFVIVASEQRPEWMLNAMQAGARNFLVKDSIASDLLGVLDRLEPVAPTANGAGGKILTVLSAGGGCGATTVALNLATELSIFGDSRFIGSASPALLIDLDSHYGGVSGYLGVKAQYGMADVLRDGDRIDTNLVRSTAIHHNDHLHVLVSPATVSPHAPAEMEYRHLARALKTARESYVHTVVDAPRLPLDVAAVLAQASALTFIVFEMNVEDIRIARLLHSYLIERGMQPDRLLPVANRYRRRKESIALKDAQRTIGSSQVSCLSNDYRSIELCVNYGKTLADQAPRSALRKEIQDLAGSVRQDAPTDHRLNGTVAT